MNTHITPVMADTFSGMSNENGISGLSQLAFEQENRKPAIDNVICQYLDGNMLKNALNFIDYVRAAKMKIKWSAVNVWSVNYKGKHVLDIIVKNDSWSVRLVFDHVAKTFGLSKHDVESIRSLVGTLRVSMPRYLEPIPAMS